MWVVFAILLGAWLLCLRGPAAWAAGARPSEAWVLAVGLGLVEQAGQDVQGHHAAEMLGSSQVPPERD